MRFALLIFILMATSFALASPHPEVWLKVEPKSARIIDPTSRSPKALHIQLPANYDFKTPYLLSSTGFEYSKGHDQKPFELKKAGRLSGIYLGFEYQGQKLAINVADVSLTSPQGPVQVFRTPNVPRFASHDLTTEYLRSTPLIEIVSDLIHEFHNSKCESLRPRDPTSSSMAIEITQLFKEWDQFIAQKKSLHPELRRALSMAKELDAVARTITFEGHPLSMLEQEEDSTVTPSQCTSLGNCPISSCEQRILALTIRNRANNSNCAQFGCRSHGDYFGVATKPNQFNIWIPSYTHRFIATCFMKDGIETAPVGDKDFELYRNRARQFRFALDAAARILYGNSSEWDLAKANGSASLDSLTHYFHPGGMPGCDPDNYDHRYSLGAKYVHSSGAKPDFDLVLNATITAKGSLPAEIPAVIAHALSSDEKIEAKKRGARNLSYEFIPFRPSGDSRDWYIDTSGASKIQTANVCVRGGLGSMVKNSGACPNVIPQYYTVPSWGYASGVEQMAFTCTFPTKKIVLGGKCDSRIQPIGNVTGAFHIRPFLGIW
jgi:hypothetical protein